MCVLGLKLCVLSPFQVNEAANLSPGKFTKINCERVQRKRNRQKIKEATKACKRLRLFKKKKNSTKLLAKEIREGSTYETAVDNQNNNHDVEEIPDPKSPPEIAHVSLQSSNIVVFDLETTGFGMKLQHILLHNTRVRRSMVLNRKLCINVAIHVRTCC